MEGSSPNAPFVVTLEFTARANSTLVVVKSDIRLTGAARVFVPLVVAIYGRAWARGLRNLKALMETGAL